MCQWAGTDLWSPLISLFQAHLRAPQGSQRGPLVLPLPRQTLLVELLAARCPTQTRNTPAQSPGPITADQLLQGASQVPRRLLSVAWDLRRGHSPHPLQGFLTLRCHRMRACLHPLPTLWRMLRREELLSAPRTIPYLMRQGTTRSPAWLVAAALEEANRPGSRLLATMAARGALRRRFSTRRSSSSSPVTAAGVQARCAIRRQRSTGFAKIRACHLLAPSFYQGTYGLATLLLRILPVRTRP